MPVRDRYLLSTHRARLRDNLKQAIDQPRRISYKVRPPLRPDVVLGAEMVASLAYLLRNSFRELRSR